MSASEPNWVRGYAMDPRSLAVARIAYCLYLLVFVDLGQIAFVADIPAELWRPPPGPMRLWPHPPSRPFVLVVIGAAEVLATLLAVGWRSRATSWALAATVLLLSGLTTCSGKIDHNIFLWLTPAFLAGQWGRAWSVDAQQGRTRPEVDPLAIAAFAVVVGFCMLSAGLPKLFGGWLNPSHQATRLHFLRNYLVFDRTQGLAPIAARITNGWFWEIGDWLTVVWEVGFIATVAKPKLFRWMLASAIGFHVAVLLVFNIGFSANLVAYAALTPWCDACPDPGPEKRRPWLLPFGLATGGVLALSPSPAQILAGISDYPGFGSAVAFSVAVAMVAARAGLKLRRQNR